MSRVVKMPVFSRIPKGEFVVMKTGTHPMRTRLRLFLDWGITFDPDGYRMPEQAARKIAYVNRDELAHNIQNRRENSPYNTEDSIPVQFRKLLHLAHGCGQSFQSDWLLYLRQLEQH